MVESVAAELLHVDPLDATAYSLLANTHGARRKEDMRRVGDNMLIRHDNT